MRDIWSVLLQTLTASGAAVLLLAVKAMFRDKLSPRWQFAVWGVLGMVLLIPAGWNGRYVLLNWPYYVELLRSALTGDYGALAQVTAPIPLPPAAGPRSLADWLFLLYVAGAVFLLARYALSYIRLRLALNRGRPVEDGRVRAVAERYELPTCPAVEVEGLPSAFICGTVKPVLALPAGAETDEKVILHELLHLRYHDAAWGLAIGFFRCLHWIDPLLWYCADQAGNDLESLCDQRVLERLEGEDRRDYGRILLSMADEKYARAPGTSSMANGGRNIRRRIEAIARFKRYPAGMGLVSVCITLVLACTLSVGARAEVRDIRSFYSPYVLAYARTVPCTTCAGAFDTYAKAVLNQSVQQRAMCAPLSEQDALAVIHAEKYALLWEDIGGALTDRKLSHPSSSDGYKIYNLTQVDEDVYEGLLALTLEHPPDGEEWDGLVHSRWRVVQRLRAEKEGDRWVIVPQEEFWAVQGDGRLGGDIGLPAWEYTATAGDFTLRMRWQTSSWVESREQTSNWFGAYSTFSTTPKPDGEFTSMFDHIMLADYTGSPEDRDKYQSIGVSSMPLLENEERPSLHGQGLINSSGGSSTGESWADRELDPGWEEDTIFLSGSGSRREGLIDLPAAYAADFYLNGTKAAELTLLPAEGGPYLD